MVRAEVDAQRLEQGTGLGFRVGLGGHVGRRLRLWARFGRDARIGHGRVDGQDVGDGGTCVDGYGIDGHRVDRDAAVGGRHDSGGARAVPPAEHAVGTDVERGARVVVGAHHEAATLVGGQRAHVALHTEGLGHRSHLLGSGGHTGREVPRAGGSGEIGSCTAEHVLDAHRHHHLARLVGHRIRCRTGRATATGADESQHGRPVGRYHRGDRRRRRVGGRPARRETDEERGADERHPAGGEGVSHVSSDDCGGSQVPAAGCFLRTRRTGRR